MTPKEFDKELDRLTMLMDEAAYAGDDKKYCELDAEVKQLFQTANAMTMPNGDIHVNLPF